MSDICGTIDWRGFTWTVRHIPLPLRLLDMDAVLGNPDVIVHFSTFEIVLSSTDPAVAVTGLLDTLKAISEETLRAAFARGPGVAEPSRSGTPRRSGLMVQMNGFLVGLVYPAELDPQWRHLLAK